MLNIYINNEEVVSNKNFSIIQEMLNTPSVILNNVYPKAWEVDKDYVSRFYHPEDYSKCKIVDETYIPYEPGTTVTSTNGFLSLTNVDNSKLFEYTALGDTQQASTPTPTNPVEVQTVTGRQDINVCGKNLFDKNTMTTRIYGYLMENLTTWAVASGGYSIRIPCEPNTNYTISANNSSETVFRAGVTDSDVIPVSGTTVPVYSVTRYSNTNVPIYVTTGANAKYIVIQVGVDTASDTFSTLQIEKGNQATTYEAYNGNTYEINLGKNLWGGVSFERTSANVKYTTNPDGSIICDGTSSGTGGISLLSTDVANNKLYKVLPPGTYTLSSPDIDMNNVRVQAIKIVGTTVSQLGSDVTVSNSSRTFTINEFTNVYVRISINAIGVVINKRIRVLLEKGSQATSYSAYKTPIELCKIGNYQDFIRKGTGKNLYNKNDITTGAYIDASGNIVSSSLVCYSDYISVKPNTTYTMSGRSSYRSQAFYDENKNFITRDTNTETFTTGSTTYYIRVNGVTSEVNNYMLELGNTQTLFEPYGYKDKWYIYKEIGKVVYNGTETWNSSSQTYPVFYTDGLEYLNKSFIPYSNYYLGVSRSNNASAVASKGNFVISFLNSSSTYRVMLTDNRFTADSTGRTNFKNWLSTNNLEVYYLLLTPTTTEITDTTLLNQLNAIELLNGINNITIDTPYLPFVMQLHYNYVNEETITDLLFCGVVKNSGNISLNPRYPHYSTLQILDFKTFLSEGELDSFVISNQTVLQAIQTIVNNISGYGFVLGNVNILNANDLIGAYSTKDKSAYDVFNYLADITQSRWTTRLVDENTVAIDFYDPSLMPQGTPINYTTQWFTDNLIDDISYNYGSQDYRNKQVMTSKQVYADLTQTETLVANGYDTVFNTEQPIGTVQSITLNGVQRTIINTVEKEAGYDGDFYYKIGNSYFENSINVPLGSVLVITYTPIVEGRQIITNTSEISRIATATNRKGIVSRYESRNDSVTSDELQKIGATYIKYKGTSEINLIVQTRKNLWNIGQRVEFNSPINELTTEYMVKKKTINRILSNPDSEEFIVYTFELCSSFNSESDINYFDNQRAKATGNIGEGKFISRNVDIENSLNIIYQNPTITEITMTGDNQLQASLTSPLID